jgi:hypothetical protein
LYALFICLLLAAPTLFFARQSAVEAQRRAEAANAAAIAQTGILAAAITQTQNLMVPMSQGCAGGPHGVPPLNWTNLQAHGAKAVNALNDAKLALARGQISDVLQQIISAEDELDALVNGVHNNCPGGANGEDPPGYNAYTSERASVKGTLDALKRSLASGAQPGAVAYIGSCDNGSRLACYYDQNMVASDCRTISCPK